MSQQQGIEELIRDTLTDPRRRLEPPPGHYQLVGERIGQVRRRRTVRWTCAAAVVVTLLMVGGLAAARPRTVPRPYLGPSPAPTPSSQYGGWHTLPRIGPGEPVQVVADGGFFYLLEDSPGTLLQLDSVNFAIVASAAVPGKVESLAVEHGGNSIWALYTRPDGTTMAREFTRSFTLVRDVPVSDKQVFDAVALDGELWLATVVGLYRIGPSDTAARLVPGLGFAGTVYALAVDPVRRRLIFTAWRAGAVDPHDPMQVNALDPATMAVTTGAALPLSKESIAVVSDHVWIAGFSSSNEPHIYQLDPDKLTVIIGTSEVNAQIGPGAIVSGGSDSLWVRDGADTGLSCVNPATGAIRQQWQVGVARVASMPGPIAIGVNQPNLVQLTVGAGCPG
jgi:hypothetical protein